MNHTSSKLFFPFALTSGGWHSDVLITINDGFITALESEAVPPSDAVRSSGVALPGMSNVHSHAFQRGMAGLAERGGPRDDHFWSWREVMYRFLNILGPEDIEAITALAYMEMLEAGFTAVGEFHYLHHDIDGQPYANSAELAERIVAAAALTGIGLTLLPVFYAHSGFGGAAPTAGQRRFITGIDDFSRLFEVCRTLTATLSGGSTGVAPHSLRAVTPPELAEICALGKNGVIHIHAAEQLKEVEDCWAALGAPPIAWLIDHAGIDRRWCLIHCTQSSSDELRRLAASKAVAGLCPVTEANLGDGIFGATDYLSENGRFGIGTDSNIAISVTQELRMLEYSQRLRDLARNRLAPQGASTGRRLFTLAASSGAQALGRPAGRLEAGARADLIVLDIAEPTLMGRQGDTLLDSWIFATTNHAIDAVYVGGEQIVREGVHKARTAILASWRITLKKLRDQV